MAPTRVTPRAAHLQQPLERPHAAGSFHLHPRRARRAHQFQVFEGGAGLGITRARLHPVGAGLATDPAQFALVFVLEIGILEDHFHFRPRAVGDFHHRAHVVGDEVPLPREHLADVHDHVELGRAVGNGLFALEDLDTAHVAAMREADDGAGGDRRAREQLRGALERVGLDADRGDVVLGRHGQSAIHLLIGQDGLEEGMIDHPGEFGESGGHKRLGADGEGRVVLGGGEGGGQWP